MRKIVLVFLVFSCIYANAYDFLTNGVYYNILSSNQVEVTYEYHARGAYEGDIVIPQVVEHDGKSYTVVRIGNWAFAESILVTSVVLPESIATIGEYNQEIKGETNVEIIPLSA